MQQTPPDSGLFKRNREKLSRMLKGASVAIVHAADEMPRSGNQFYPYRQSSDFYYLTGINQEGAVLAVCPGHPNENYREVLFLVEPDPARETWNGKKLSKDEATRLSGITSVIWSDEFDQVWAELMYYANTVYLPSHENPKYVPVFPDRDRRFLDRCKNMYPLHYYERLSPLLSRMRTRKEPAEIEQMRQAISITRKAFDRVLRFTRPGVMEYEVEAEISHEFTINGASGHAYAPIVASGKNALVLHYIENSQECKDGELLLLDFGAEYNNYAADCSRTIPVNGRFSPRQRELYEATLRVFYKARLAIVKGTSIAEFHKMVCSAWEEEHVRLGLYTARDLKEQDPAHPLFFKYYMHGTSHFIGLDVHDRGDRSMMLESGMILSCEPGIYVPEEGIGIRLENDILVTEQGPVDLMEGFPLEVEEIEEMMNNR
jgi:Xaa-Pro aminopeptidase